MNNPTKNIFLLISFSSAIFGMENGQSFVSRDKVLAEYLGSRITHDTNQKLIASTKQQNPIALFNELDAYYQERQKEVSIFDYFASFSINLTKTRRYLNLALRINRDINVPILENAQQKTNDSVILDEILEAADTGAKKKEIWDREWPLESVKCDLEVQLSKLKEIKKSAAKADEWTNVTESKGEEFASVMQQIDTQLENIEHAIAALQYRRKIYKMNSSIVDYLVRKTQKGTLKKNVDELASCYPLHQINSIFKSNNNNNSILHALCDQSLPVNEFETVVAILTSSGQSLNAANDAGESVFDYAQNRQLDATYIAVIQKHGGLSIQDLKSSFKKSSEDATATKKVLRLSDEGPVKKERERRRVLTQSLG